MTFLARLRDNPTAHGGPVGWEKLALMASEFEISLGREVCWIWPTARVGQDAYAQIMILGHNMRAHRAMFTLLRGNIPPGLILDHARCDTPACVNPWCMEPITVAENNRRAVQRGRRPRTYQRRR